MFGFFQEVSLMLRLRGKGERLLTAHCFPMSDSSQGFFDAFQSGWFTPSCPMLHVVPCVFLHPLQNSLDSSSCSSSASCPSSAWDLSVSPPLSAQLSWRLRELSFLPSERSFGGECSGSLSGHGSCAGVRILTSLGLSSCALARCRQLRLRLGA